ncbi:MAG: class I SAM-dependent methyltransferase, partial [Comamonas sp.]|nr:class I SAM-dependent methyltransferase [Comamonas sp.]
MQTKQHWEQVYATKAADAVSWYAPHLDASLQYIQATQLGTQAAIVDIGGGEATLVDDLLEAGYRQLTALDISAKALEVAAQRLGERAAGVQWIAADVLEH